ncbi:UNVERIFIED_CONTAM: hypothetical protein Sradi_5079700 [Sesamum radiatum]|uniref:Uncharacterized protein n=1 Tax=Sesamum radiatum TaxID=300843 RepID=A0AAW2M2S4_SESRA
MPLGKKLNSEAEDGAVKENDEDSKDRNGAGEQLDDHKMLRICDKLIEVFMVDKPTPTDWRRLLTFSKEWIIFGLMPSLRCTWTDCLLQLQNSSLLRSLED